jgi:hypothetical protein
MNTNWAGTKEHSGAVGNLILEHMCQLEQVLCGENERL